MFIATTTTFFITLPDDVDLSSINNIVFTIVQGSLTINKMNSDVVIVGQVVSVKLSQEETLNFKKGKAECQLNWSYPDGTRGCINIVPIKVKPNLYMEVLE